MKLPRRRKFLHLAACAAAVPSVARRAGEERPASTEKCRMI